MRRLYAALVALSLVQVVHAKPACPESNTTTNFCLSPLWSFTLSTAPQMAQFGGEGMHVSVGESFAYFSTFINDTQPAIVRVSLNDTSIYKVLATPESAQYYLVEVDEARNMLYWATPVSPLALWKCALNACEMTKELVISDVTFTDGNISDIAALDAETVKVWLFMLRNSTREFFTITINTTSATAVTSGRNFTGSRHAPLIVGDKTYQLMFRNSTRTKKMRWGLWNDTVEVIGMFYNIEYYDSAFAWYSPIDNFIWVFGIVYEDSLMGYLVQGIIPGDTAETDLYLKLNKTLIPVVRGCGGRQNCTVAPTSGCGDGLCSGNETHASCSLDCCPVGTVDNSATLDEVDCGTCGSGYYVPEGQSGNCSMFGCVGPFYSNDTQSKTPCVLCSPGRETEGSPQTACVLCQPGTSDSDEDSATKCEACPYGTYVPSYGSIGSCGNFNCSPGSIDSDQDTTTPCTPCDSPGLYVPSGQSGNCTAFKCASGTTDNDSNSSTECIKCGAGTYVPEGQSGACTEWECEEGTLDTDGLSTTGCERCWAGTYVPAGKTGNCSEWECEAGTIDEDSEANTTCVRCPGGTYVGKGQHGECKEFACEAGYIDSDNDSGTACEECGAGTYVPEGTEGSCSEWECVAGTTDEDSKSSTECKECTGAGLYVARGSTGACEKFTCKAGTIDADRKSGTECEVCEVKGSYVPAGSAGNCSDRVYECGAGQTDNDSNSSTECVACGEGTYTSGGASGACSEHKCGAGTTDEDSNASTACTQCAPGTYAAEGTSGSCAECGSGEYDDDTDPSTECVELGKGKGCKDGWCVYGRVCLPVAVNITAEVKGVCANNTQTFAWESSISGRCFLCKGKTASIWSCGLVEDSVLFPNCIESSSSLSGASNESEDSGAHSVTLENSSQYDTDGVGSFGISSEISDEKVATDGGSGTSAGRIVGAVLGSVFGFALIGGCLAAAFCWRRGAKEEEAFIECPLTVFVNSLDGFKEMPNDGSIGFSVTPKLLTFGAENGPVSVGTEHTQEITLMQNADNDTGICVVTPAGSLRGILKCNAQEITLSHAEKRDITVTVMIPCTTVFESSVCFADENRKQYVRIPVKVESQISSKLDAAEVKLGDVLGTGAFATVFRGKWRGNDVAVKSYNMTIVVDPVLRDDILRELDIGMKLRMQNIIAFYGSAIGENAVYLVMEYVPLGSLASILQKEALDIQFKVRVMLDTARGMSFLHNNRIINRDLKTDNILVASLDPNAPVCGKLSDFNTCRFVGVDSKTKTRGVGTPIYMAPEVLDGKDYSEQADVYSYGICLWSVWTQRVPFDTFTETQYSIYAFVSEGSRLPLPDSLPEKLADLTNRAWAHDQQKRPSFGVIVSELESFHLSM